jgi:hypothetical protein
MLGVTTPSKRPHCPECGREMVFALIEAGNLVFQSWICDCREQPPGVVADILRAREWYKQSLEFQIVLTDGEPA